ncbi:general odorant-binding protein 56a-like [Culex pipiens pallens]|uniref:general odorant-binding protein 56a-like n=1 Tax=Culex pipiens pallens TaxID=42434 RepID=UPI0019548A3A|nr:general odorant-binding protein 56a-like [Culex pipiens pallens]
MRHSCVFITLTILASSCSGSMEQVKQACMEQEGVSQADADLFNKMDKPVTRPQKCFYACMFERFGTSDGHRFDTEVFLENSEKLAQNDQKMLNAAREMAERCDGVENEDRCELAADILNCLRGD